MSRTVPPDTKPSGLVSRVAPGSAALAALRALAGFLASAAILATAPPAAAADPEVTVRLEIADGTARSGTLDSIDASAVRFRDGDAAAAVSVAEVRRLDVVPLPAAEAPPAPVTVTLVDGGRLAGDAFTWDGTVAAISRAAGSAVLPIDLVQLVAWRRPADGPHEPAWLSVLPERPETDLVVVDADDGWECVACAIESVAADTVTVLLDGERIPVRRSKVAGLRWLRDRAEPGGVRIAVAGGSLRAAAVAWSTEGLEVDGRVRLPADWLRGIDYAAGRTVRLADVAAVRTEVAPFFAGLEQVEGLASFLAPRPLRPAGAEPGGAADIVVRPRTVAAWQVPPRCRRFRTTLRPAAWGTASGTSTVAFELDGREVIRAAVGGSGSPGGDPAAGGKPIDVDVSGARRLTVTVDVAPGGGVGCPVRFGDPVFDQ